MPKTSPEFWQKRGDSNVQNDQKHFDELTALGWNVIVIWECEVKQDLGISIKRGKNELEDCYIHTVTGKTEQYKYI